MQPAASPPSSSSVAVSYGPSAGISPGFQRSRVARGPMGDVVQALAAAIADADLWLLHEIDPQLLLARGGFAILPARQLLFFHPRYVARLLAATPAALGEAPLKFVLAELPDASVSLRWNDPDAAFERYGIPALTELGAELGSLCERIADAALEARR